ncbi:hypothetical protein LTS03_011910 [Exophiala xenobiotica]|nr:hypothetical protein LTR92_011519 [Exophiala xenobiotica]KAK5354312.1 hypothetical protein LTS03_011910 [Exophiala xenobiotica]KAK5431432.1 hypothetical protein LTR18_011365 [Exophiala xenobiotica]
MSGMEVIGAISAVISIIDASIKIYESAQKDSKLSETFKIVGNRLPIFLDTLQTCKSHLQPVRDSLPADVCEALGKDPRSFLAGERDAWEKRYVELVKRLGKGNKVEELMVSITEHAQLVVNHHALNSAKPGQIAARGKIIKEMQSSRSSLPEEESSGMTFNCRGREGRGEGGEGEDEQRERRQRTTDDQQCSSQYSVSESGKS